MDYNYCIVLTCAGKKSFKWMGPRPSINVQDPKLIREILLKHDIFQKPKGNSLSKLVVNGMVMYEGEQWSKVRKIANPAFHQDKLKVSHSVINPFFFFKKKRTSKICIFTIQVILYHEYYIDRKYSFYL